MHGLREVKLTNSTGYVLVANWQCRLGVHFSLNPTFVHTTQNIAYVRVPLFPL